MVSIFRLRSCGQSPSRSRDRDRGVRESVGYRLGHCAFGYRERSIMGAPKKTYSGKLKTGPVTSKKLAEA